MKTVLVTPSYAPDFERCRALCDSVDRFLGGHERHCLIVDRKDAALFGPLAGTGRDIIVKEDILPPWLHKVPFSGKWWFSTRTLPVRGWILQQIVKLAVAEYIDAQVYMFVDSDVLFIRPFHVERVVRQGRVRLFRAPRKTADYGDPRHRNWYRFAGRLFGPFDPAGVRRDYISQMNTWRRETLLMLHRHMEKVTGRDWKRVLCNTLDFSEYILYGIFAEFVMGDNSLHYGDDAELCHCSWHHDIASDADMTRFASAVQPHHVAILVQSNLGLAPERYLGPIGDAV